MCFKEEYEDICEAGFQGDYNDYLRYRKTYGQEVDHTDTKSHLTFLYNRLMEVYGENKNYDYMKKFKDIIDSMN